MLNSIKLHRTFSEMSFNFENTPVALGINILAGVLELSANISLYSNEMSCSCGLFFSAWSHVSHKQQTVGNARAEWTLQEVRSEDTKLRAVIWWVCWQKSKMKVKHCKKCWFKTENPLWSFAWGKYYPEINLTGVTFHMLAVTKSAQQTPSTVKSVICGNIIPSTTKRTWENMQVVADTHMQCICTHTRACFMLHYTHLQ